ncbi:MAG: hypothetical protein A2312_01135 [Candidatus Staskawiczbacteria bacterium RIFOXYB2_FULL_32_9]|uniref:Uncharacterized protein n=1 Tax=Candidatus Staskawiczbacteria bacterium RIFOXYD1_FULL_32_13 TaxID=1802234 RepID=A0A1G2JQD2_9BACT|nr:MAG: hypothetical protein UR22_C0003G0011 [Parcubacteria group bacterium GW2011_GWC2_32_10]OGZ78955.1 MAG: hypothetical protein A2256_02750 [Candidatus Staskawiczbacteria bacterium RIFOXYA2_FULL_32_7]OGZ80426.1 MAG: hypothetical protein A2360_00980 [Candidatus Staskawiczbacteria bacterium RIFOXYB1_FULL_32_11]OGZ81320.1 MAG: hypothetical protein A2312_01135 [Candidatus Staskawiczbacteria bacterium RIFOXYB2_FULL_32_9]OGZ87644.1 MAG: hypothetical protein A2463_01390 [Candidatus Staskawiczbacter
MINKFFVVGFLVIVFSVNMNNLCLAKQQGNDSAGGVQVQIQAEDQQQNQNQNQNDSQNFLGAKEQEQEQEREREQEQKSEQNGQENGLNGQNRRSAVANFVQKLQEVANRQSGIGQQVKIIAQEQNQSEETTLQAMEKVQTRSKVRTFFLGTDYKNLGTLRSEMVQTRNRLNQLEDLAENIQDENDKEEFQNQMQALEQEQQNIEDFIKSQESKFSLFGWLVKLFNK